jgi:hypothetical protein
MSREVSVEEQIRWLENDEQVGIMPTGLAHSILASLRRVVLLERVAEAGRQCIAYCDIPFLDDTDPQPDPEVFVDRDLLMKLKSALRDHDKLGKEG